MGAWMDRQTECNPQSSYRVAALLQVLRGGYGDGAAKAQRLGLGLSVCR